jgi:hypothetical protein
MGYVLWVNWIQRAEPHRGQDPPAQLTHGVAVRKSWKANFDVYGTPTFVTRT